MQKFPYVLCQQCCLDGRRITFIHYQLLNSWPLELSSLISRLFEDENKATRLFIGLEFRKLEYTDTWYATGFIDHLSELLSQHIWEIWVWPAPFLIFEAELGNKAGDRLIGHWSVLAWRIFDHNSLIHTPSLGHLMRLMGQSEVDRLLWWLIWTWVKSGRPH